MAFGVASGLGACNALLDVPDPVLRSSDAGDLDATGDVVVNEAAADVDAGDAPGPGDADGGSDTEGGNDAPVGCCGTPGCPDLSSDENNCGACGHGCQGGQCNAGHCGPVLLAGSPTEYRGLKSLYGLVVLGDRLIGTDWYQPMTLVYTTPVDASLPTVTPLYPPPLADGGLPVANGASDQLATDGERVFFGVYRDANGWDAGIYSLELDGAAAKVASTSYMGSVAADGRFLYWSDANAVWVSNEDGSNVQSFPLQGSYYSQIVAAGGRAFFTSNGVLLGATPPNLGTATAYSGSTNVSSFTADASSLYWVDLQSDRVYRAPLDGSAAPVEMTPPGLSLTRTWVTILVDDRFLYVFNYQIGASPLGGSIVRFPKNAPATSVETMLKTNDGYGAIAQDSKTLYYTTYGSDVADSGGPYSAVWKLAK